MATCTIQTRTFAIQYAGLASRVNANIDPSGRTDLLKVLDHAQANGQVIMPSREIAENARLELDHQAVVIRNMADGDVVLVVPLYMLVSVGYVIEEEQHIVALKIGEVYSADLVDLAVLFVKEKETAEEVCNHLDGAFQRLYREVLANTVNENKDKGPKRSVSMSSFSPKSDVVSSSKKVLDVYGITEVPSKTKHNSTTLSLSTVSTSTSSKVGIDRINEYLTMLAVCLSHDELNKFAVLLKRWRAKEMPVLEFAYKLMELYGPERKHLLARMKSLLRDVSAEESAALTEYLRQNGITENAAISLDASPSTGDFSAATDSSLPTSDECSSGLWSAGRRNLPVECSVEPRPTGFIQLHIAKLSQRPSLAQTEAFGRRRSGLRSHIRTPHWRRDEFVDNHGKQPSQESVQWRIPRIIQQAAQAI
ncbi:unnamed protein product [Bursaphelenchus okinawaensis]|uniref:Cerebral cavernous malformations 2 harmonin-homology domain-containing protein n=1 Tax=Bursaphelenchus okinawaensis TaxID=465554 RepID=A0A811KVE1_9BILA|nr:unnamed protein product [Bursaphelenchus okinawaensis]CAG9112632.1 unnamed protein product [Bursaphelenchus okinawaensis]